MQRHHIRARHLDYVYTPNNHLQHTYILGKYNEEECKKRVFVCGVGGGASKNPTYEKANEANQLLGIPVLLLKQSDQIKTGKESHQQYPKWINHETLVLSTQVSPSQ
jgi:hypothetical protein